MEEERPRARLSSCTILLFDSHAASRLPATSAGALTSKAQGQTAPCCNAGAILIMWCFTWCTTENHPRNTTGKEGQQSMQFSDKDEHVYFWFPLLAGLSELTFDPRPDVRYTALEVRTSHSTYPLSIQNTWNLLLSSNMNCDKHSFTRPPWPPPSHLCPVCPWQELTL